MQDLFFIFSLHGIPLQKNGHFWSIHTLSTANAADVTLLSPHSSVEKDWGRSQTAPFGDTFGDTSAPERTEAKTRAPVSPEKQAEGTGFEPATGCPAPHFQ